MLCPCERCICLAICKHKSIARIVRDCALVANFLRPYATDEVIPKAVKEVSSIMQRRFIPIRAWEGETTLNAIRDQDLYETMKEKVKCNQKYHAKIV